MAGGWQRALVLKRKKDLFRVNIGEYAKRIFSTILNNVDWLETPKI